jgi:hypothetical protein
MLFPDEFLYHELFIPVLFFAHAIESPGFDQSGYQNFTHAPSLYHHTSFPLLKKAKLARLTLEIASTILQEMPKIPSCSNTAVRYYSNDITNVSKEKKR